MGNAKQIFITGAGSGLGLATTKMLAEQGHRVYATVRSGEGFDALVNVKNELLLAHKPHDIRPLYFDVTSLALPEDVKAALLGCDVLINNAGVGAEITLEDKPLDTNVLDMSLGVLDDAIEINALAPWRLMTYAIPEMKKRGYGRVINVSSARASMGQWTGDMMFPSYRLSKNMLNAITKMVGLELAGTNVLVNSLCPGWCQTNMGGPTAPDTPEQGAQRIVALMDLPAGGPNGVFFIDGQPAPY